MSILPNAYTCFKCGRSLGSFDLKTFHPTDGCDFITYGNYGSVEFDPCNGDKLHVIICDTCIEKGLGEGTVMLEGVVKRSREHSSDLSGEALSSP